MSRLFQAFERAREIEGRPADSAVAPDTAEEPWAVTPQVVLPRIEPSVVEAERVREVRPAGEIRCPTCSKVHEGSPRGPWGTWFLSLLRKPPYRCRSCRRRFFPQANEEGRRSLELLTFLNPTDGRAFHEVVGALARDEHALRAHGRSI